MARRGVYICHFELVFIYYRYVENNWCFFLYLLQNHLSMKVPTHGEKLKKFSDVPIPLEVRDIFDNYSLLWLLDYSITMLDALLLSGFVERWHKETPTFHLPFSDMTIILDDVSSLIHLLFQVISSLLILLTRSFHVLLIYSN